METTNVGKETLVRASKILENPDGTKARYEICFKMELTSGKVIEVLSEGGDNGATKLPLYQLIHLARQLYEHVGAPIPKRYGMTVTYSFYGALAIPVLCIGENDRIVDITIDVAAKHWLPYYELKRFACYVHWLHEIDPYKYQMAESGEKEFKPLRDTKWELKFN